MSHARVRKITDGNLFTVSYFSYPHTANAVTSSKLACEMKAGRVKQTGIYLGVDFKNDLLKYTNSQQKAAGCTRV